MGGGGNAQGGRRRGRPGGVRRVEQAQGREDFAHHGRVLHRGDAPQPAAAGAMLGKAAGIFALAQIICHSAQPTVAKFGGTSPPSDSTTPSVATRGPAPSEP